MFTSVWQKISRTLDSFILGERDFETARILVPIFYYALFFYLFLQLEGLSHVLARDISLFDPRWPIFWLFGGDHASIASLALIGSVLASLVAGIFPLSRLARISGFLGIFAYHAYMSSFGSPFHQFDYALWLAFILIFLPSMHGVSAAESRRAFSLVFWCAQAFLLLTYSMAGFLKVVYGVFHALAPSANIFSPDAGVLHIASQLLLMQESVPLASFALEHPSLTYLMFLGVLYVQLFAIIAAFRPELHRVWGVALVLFHIGTFLVMRAVFPLPAILALIFLVSSPFATRFDVRTILRSLPLAPTLRRVYSLMSFARSRQNS